MPDDTTYIPKETIVTSETMSSGQGIAAAGERQVARLMAAHGGPLAPAQNNEALRMILHLRLG